MANGNPLRRGFLVFVGEWNKENGTWKQKNAKPRNAAAVAAAGVPLKCKREIYWRMEQGNRKMRQALLRQAFL